MNELKMAFCAALAAVLCASVSPAADWPQWRGPGRCGVAPAGPALAATWPKDGPKKLWQSEKIIGDFEGGWASPTVAAGKVFTYSHWKTVEPIIVRKLTADGLKKLDGLAQPLPEDLLAKVETARLSEERAALKGPEVGKWVQQWLSDNLNESKSTTQPATQTPLFKKYGRYVETRLNKGKAALAPEALAKLETIKDKEFATQEALDAWFAENNLDAAVKKAVADVIPTKRDVWTDTVLCFDAASGATQWKKDFPGVATDYPTSSTPTAQDGRVYLPLSNGRACCFDARDGTILWEINTGMSQRMDSSFLLLDGKAILLCGALTAFNAADGKVVWKQPKVGGQDNSAIVWVKDGKNYLICNSGRGVNCVDPEKGDVLWSAPGGGSSSVVIDDDIAVVLGDNAKGTGLTAYKMTLAKAEKLWTVEANDRGASPLIYKGNVYCYGGGKLRRVGLADGVVKWTQGAGGEFASPVGVDGKVIVSTDDGKKLLLLDATSEKLNVLGTANLSMLRCTSPAIVDGKMYIRCTDGVACFDLTANN